MENNYYGLPEIVFTKIQSFTKEPRHAADAQQRLVSSSGSGDPAEYFYLILELLFTEPHFFCTKGLVLWKTSPGHGDCTGNFCRRFLTEYLAWLDKTDSMAGVMAIANKRSVLASSIVKRLDPVDFYSINMVKTLIAYGLRFDIRDAADGRLPSYHVGRSAFNDADQVRSTFRTLLDKGVEACEEQTAQYAKFNAANMYDLPYDVVIFGKK